VKIVVILSSLIAIGLLTSLSADPVATDPVGVIAQELTPGADNLVTIPLKTTPLFVGPVGEVMETSGDSLTFAIDSALQPDEDALASFFFVRFLNGAAQGKYFTILGNDQSTITIETLGDDLSTVAANDLIEINEYWTLGTLFPPSTQTAIVESTNILLSGRRSEILVPDLLGVGRNRAPRDIYYLVTDGWRKAGEAQTSFDNQVILPGTFIIIRQHADAGPRSFTLSGHVPMEHQAHYLFEESGIIHDNILTHGRPVGVRLADLGFGEEFKDSLSNLLSGRRDELLVWVNPAPRNPAPDAIFFRVDGVWRQSGVVGAADDFVIEPHMPFIVRKRPAPESRTALWTNQPVY